MSNFFEAGRAAMTSNKDDWETPQALFDALDAVHHYTLDPCCTHENAKCERHYTVAEDGLSRSWEGEVVFCNPPYGRGMEAWVRKCAEESRHASVTLLVPARTDTSWFARWVAPYARVAFIRGRLKYELGGGRSEQLAVPVDARVLRRGPERHARRQARRGRLRHAADDDGMKGDVI